LNNSYVNHKKIIKFNDKISESDIKTLFKEFVITTEKPKNYKYRIDTKGCKILNWPLFDGDTKKLFKNLTNEKINCDSGRPLIKIQRVNSTWIQLDWSDLSYTPFCYISELIRGKGEHSLRFGK
jgi:hypothetical protein